MCCTVISFGSQPVADNTATVCEWRIHRRSGYFERNGRERRTEEGVCRREVTIALRLAMYIARPRHPTHPLIHRFISTSLFLFGISDPVIGYRGIDSISSCECRSLCQNSSVRWPNGETWLMTCQFGKKSGRIVDMCCESIFPKERHTSHMRFQITEMQAFCWRKFGHIHVITHLFEQKRSDAFVTFDVNFKMLFRETLT